MGIFLIKEVDMNNFDKARSLLHEFKGDAYIYGEGVLPQIGELVTKTGGKSCALVSSSFSAIDPFVDELKAVLQGSGVELKAHIPGPKPNAPVEDVERITEALIKVDPDCMVSFGGGSVIDAAKAAEVLRTYGGTIEDYFGSGNVTEALEKTGKKCRPHLAIQTAASSAAHLTKYSNITNLKTGQKKLIVDEAIVPPYAVFDYRVTRSCPAELTKDGAMDGIAHMLEVLYGSVGKPFYGKVAEIAETGIGIIVESLPRVLKDPDDAQAREGLCLGTDLGGYAIMVGGTNGGHLTSFSLVDILSHGRACAIMNPYYTVFFAPNIGPALKVVAKVYAEAGYMEGDLDTAGSQRSILEKLSSRELGEAVAQAMLTFQKKVGFPTTLSQVEGFSHAHIERALKAAKNPQLKMKLENMPQPLQPEMIDDYMGPVLHAAVEGRLELIKNVNS